MSVQLDETLIAQARRAPRHDELTLEERVAIYIFWRMNVRVPVLAKVFQCSKNTVYASCLTGDAASYVSGHRAQQISDLVARMGFNKAYAKYITDDMVNRVNAANKELIARNSLKRTKRAA